MTTISKQPDDCTQEERSEFQRLVEKGGEVDVQSLPSGICRAEALVMHFESNVLVAVAGLKNLIKKYRKRVFTCASASLDPAQFRFELGWIYVEQSHRGCGLSNLGSGLID